MGRPFYQTGCCVAVVLLCVQDPLRALIFDSYYDPYRGVVCQFRVVDGKVSKGDTVVMMNTGKEYTLDEIGVLAPVKTPVSVSCYGVGAGVLKRVGVGG
jgi:GTP-binding protein LepA